VQPTWSERFTMFFIDSEYKSVLVDYIKVSKIRRVLIVHGKNSFARNSLRDDILSSLHEAKCVEEIHFFSDFSSNPSFDCLQNALEQFRPLSFDGIIGAGGGSVMDMAKLIRFFLCFSGDIEHSSYEVLNNAPIHLICVPTTAGTGAEATQFAVVYKNGTKYSVDHTGVLPDLAIVVPKYTYGNPAYLTACSGFDALAQAIESVWSLSATEESLEYAQQAIALIYHALPVAVKTNKTDARDALAQGAWLAGKAINITRTTAPHAYSYVFTSKYNLPHGHAVALTFPFFVNWNIQRLDLLNDGVSLNVYTERIALLRKLLSLTDDPGQQFLSYLADIRLVPDIPYNVDIDLILNSVNVDRLKNNPVKVNSNELKKYLIKMRDISHK